MIEPPDDPVDPDDPDDPVDPIDPVDPVDPVDPTNNPPEAQNNEAEVSEDGPAIEIDVLANDSDPDGDPLTIASVSGVTAGVTVTIQGDPGNQRLLYNPGEAFQFLIDGGTEEDTFTYTINDGRGGTATATVTVTILGADDLPTSEDGSVEVLTGATFSFSADDFVFNDPDDGDEFKAIKLVSNPGDGTLTVAGNPVNIDDIILVDDLGSLVFDQGPLGVGNSTSFDFRVKNTRDFLSDESYTMTLGIVANPNAPKIDLDGNTATGIVEALNREYLEGPVGTVTQIVLAENVRFDLPPANSLSQVVVTLTGVQDVDEVLSLSASIAGIDVTGDGTTEVTLTNTGSASVDNFQTLLRQITYKNDGIDTDNPTEGPRTVTIRAVDDGGLESNPAIVTIDVIAVNDPPSIHGNGVTPAATTDEPYNLGNLFAAEAFSDPDAGGENVSVSLSVTADPGGTFNYTGSTLTGKFTGLDSNSLTITAPISEINTAIQNGNLRYVPNVEDDFELFVEINDQGNSGSEGHNNALTDSTTFTIPIQNLAGITEMTITVISFGSREVVLPASAFVASGRRDNVTIHDIGVANNIKLGTNGIQQTDGGQTVTVQLRNLHQTSVNNTGEFQYTIRDDNSVEDTQTVTVTYINSTMAGGSTPPLLPPDVGTLSEGINILYGRSEISNTLVGGAGDDFLIAPQNSDVLYGGAGNDTLVGGDYPLSNSANGSPSDTYVFDRSDIVVDGQGFNATSIDAIRNHPYYNTILNFNRGNNKDWAREVEAGFADDNDVIKLTGFGINDPADDAALGVHLNRQVIQGSTLNNIINRLTGDQRFFMVLDGTNFNTDDGYLLYDEDGNHLEGNNTYIVAKLRGDYSIGAPGLNADDIRVGDFTFQPDAFNPPFP